MIYNIVTSVASICQQIILTNTFPSLFVANFERFIANTVKTLRLMFFNRLKLHCLELEKMHCEKNIALLRKVNISHPS